jgi:hypothetical protein
MKRYFEPYLRNNNAVEETVLIQRNPNVLKKNEAEGNAN